MENLLGSLVTVHNSKSILLIKLWNGPVIICCCDEWPTLTFGCNDDSVDRLSSDSRPSWQRIRTCSFCTQISRPDVNLCWYPDIRCPQKDMITTILSGFLWRFAWDFTQVCHFYPCLTAIPMAPTTCHVPNITHAWFGPPSSLLHFAVSKLSPCDWHLHLTHQPVSMSSIAPTSHPPITCCSLP